MKRRSLKQDKLARVYDTEILPIWAQRFGRMLLAEAKLTHSGLVLNVACGTGYPALELLEKMDGGRIIAIDSSSALLDVARSKAGEKSGKSIFFRTEGNKDSLSFDSDVYDLTFSNLGLSEMQTPPQQALVELARVTSPGGQVLVTMPLRGTWGEFLDIYREVLTKHDRHDTLEALNEYEASIPEPETALAWLEQAGLTNVDLVVEEFSLLFKSSREFFFAPVIEFGPLREWKQLAGKGQEMQDVFWFIKEAIDAYFGGRAFSVTVVAGCLSGIKPRDADEDADEDEPERSADKALAAKDASPEPVSLRKPARGPSGQAPEDPMDVMVTHPTMPDSAVPLLGTGEISIHELEPDELEEDEDSTLNEVDVDEKDIEDAPTSRPEALADLDLPFADEDQDDEADTGVRNVDDLPDHLRQAIADAKITLDDD